MSNNVSVFSTANLPSVADLAKSLSNLHTGASVGGFAILKMEKGDGQWIYGADQTEVSETDVFAVNPFSFIHGFIAWGDGVVLAEKTVSITQPLPEMPPAPAESKKGWELQVGVSMKLGDTEIKYSATSSGGKRAVQGLAAAIAAQVGLDPTKPVPMIKLATESYKHKKYGKTFNPIFEIIDFIGMNDAPTLEAPATRRRKP